MNLAQKIAKLAFAGLFIFFLAAALFHIPIPGITDAPHVVQATDAWQPNTTYQVGAQATYAGRLYQAVQTHISQTGFEPPNVPALWQDLGTAPPVATVSATRTLITMTCAIITPTKTSATPPATATKSPTPTKTGTGCTMVATFTPVATNTPTRLPCGSIVTATPSPTNPPTATKTSTATKTATACGVIVVTNTPTPPVPTNTVTKTPSIVWSVVNGCVRQGTSTGPGVPNVSIYSALGPGPGTLKATTDSNGCYQFTYTTMGHQETFRIWTSPVSAPAEWSRITYGGSFNNVDFVIGGGTPVATISQTPIMPSQTPIPTSTKTATSPTGYPAWAPNTAYAVNQIVSYAGLNYKCIQAHTSQVTWEPPNVPALWGLI